MAVTQADFNRIWASTSPLKPYNFSNTNYLQGWNFVGSTPPARQMWDFLQKRNDEKAQWLYNNKLPLSGGTMTGSIQYVDNGKVFTIGKTAAGNVDLSWHWDRRAGAGLALRNTDYSSPGEFMLYARDANNSCALTGKPDGSLTWGNVSITDGSFLTVRYVNVTTRSETSQYSISAPAVSGYQFLCWVTSATSGYVSYSYIALAWNANTTFWVGSPRDGSVNCTALYVRKW